MAQVLSQVPQVPVVLAAVVHTLMVLVHLAYQVKVMLVVMVVSEAAAGVAVLVQQVALRRARKQGVMVVMGRLHHTRVHQ